METSMAVFRGKGVRKTIHNNEWWFSVADVVEVLTDSTDPRQYIKKMRQRDSELNSYWGTICTPLRLKALERKTRKEVVSPENYPDIPQKKRKQLNEKE